MPYSHNFWALPDSCTNGGETQTKGHQERRSSLKKDYQSHSDREKKHPIGLRFVSV
jgi:hypothetical protein